MNESIHARLHKRTSERTDGRTDERTKKQTKECNNKRPPKSQSRTCLRFVIVMFKEFYHVIFFLHQKRFSQSTPSKCKHKHCFSKCKFPLNLTLAKSCSRVLPCMVIEGPTTSYGNSNYKAL